MNRSFLVTAIVLLLTIQKSCGLTYYLGVTNATDSVDCGISASFPCATLNYLLNLAEAGDSLSIENGTYTDQPNVTITTENITIISEGI